MKNISYTIAVIFIIQCTIINESCFTQWMLQDNPYHLGGSILGKIQYVSANEGWVSAGDGKLLHTTNGGANWLIVSPEPVDTLFSWSDPALSISFINLSTGWIIRTKMSGGNYNGARVYKTTNSGVSWSKLTIPSYDAGIYIQFVDANNGWILIFNSGYTGGGIFKTTNGGLNWNSITPPVGGFPFFINANTGWLMPTNGGSLGNTSDTIRKTTNGGVNWFAPFGTNAQVNYRSIHFSDFNNGWVVGENMLVKKTSNGGMTWTNVPIFGYPIAGKSRAVFFLNPNTGWIGVKNEATNDGYVFRTNNGGTSWDMQIPPIQNPNGSNAIFSIHFFDANYGGLVADSGRICRTTNGGNPIGIQQISSEIPNTFSLSQNYPNPFNPVTKIIFDVPRSDIIKLVVYDFLGREVSTPVNQQLNPGTYEVDFDGSNMTSGVYFYKIFTVNYTETKKMVLLK
ncbi:MAG TPA: hypothetical protein DCX92_04485 [Bacteroidetes bacterium]|nr:hypothetical protein [Bacteroidota bacterium]